MNTPKIVFLLVTNKEKPVAVYANKVEAEAKAVELNNSPWLNVDTLDPDVPYKVEPWAVQGLCQEDGCSKPPHGRYMLCALHLHEALAKGVA